MIRNIVFDFGRVIVDFDETKMTRAFISDENEVSRVRDTVFDRLYWDKLDLGAITDEEVKEGIRSRLPAHLIPAAQLVYDHWIDNVDILPGIKEAIRTAKEKAEGIYLLSNISVKFVKEYASNPAVADILSLFDGLVFSGPLQLVKPDARIFRYLLDTYELCAEETLFIDDSPKNVAGAEALGIQTYLFDGNTAKLKEYIASLS